MIGCGDYHSFAGTLANRVFAWGLNNYGQLGTGNRINCDTPTLIECSLHGIIISIGGGTHHSMILTDTSLYTFGRGTFGQLGHDKPLSCGATVADIADKLTPCGLTLFNNSSVKKIATGSHYSMCITEVGQLFTWGAGLDFVLGSGSEQDIRIPTLVPMNNPVVNISAGGSHSIILNINT